MASRISLMVKSGTWNSLPYVSTSLPYLVGAGASSEASEDSEVDEGDWRGESMGETTALESESKVAEVMFLRRNGLLAAGRLEAVEGAMMCGLGGSIGRAGVHRVFEKDDGESGGSWVSTGPDAPQRSRLGGGWTKSKSYTPGTEGEPRSTTEGEGEEERWWGSMQEKRQELDALSAGPGSRKFVWVCPFFRGSIL
jgi:hypothetical protein